MPVRHITIINGDAESEAEIVIQLPDLRQPFLDSRALRLPIHSLLVFCFQISSCTLRFPSLTSHPLFELLWDGELLLSFKLLLKILDPFADFSDET